MAQTKEFFTRIQHKHDIEANWIKAVNFIPLAGEIIVYDKDEKHEYARIKIGDGNTKINELPFMSSKVATDEDIIKFVSEMGIADPVTTSDGSVYTNANGDIYVL